MTDLADYLREQRWFAAKARDLGHAAVTEEIPLGDDLRIAFVEVTFSSGTHETYQFLLGPDDTPDVLDTRAGELLTLVAANADVRGGASVVRFRSTGDLDRPGPSAGMRPIGAEQSNSSIVLDDRVVLKCYRRLEPGINPDLELTRFLTEHGFAHVPALRGYYEVEGEGIDATLGLVQTFVADGRDGWQVALEEIRTDPDRFLVRLGSLGEVVGRLHAVLASEATDPAFAPEEPSQESVGLLTATVDEEIERMFLELDAMGVGGAIAGRGEDVRELLRLLTQVTVGGRVIRHHGDLHLGQTLLAGGEWMLTDFEGEPARPLVERRRKRSPLRDVAGMLRSFAYAASASELRHGTPAPAGWEAQARATFLDGYFATVDETLLPPGRAATDHLLTIFELEKTIYELRYEIDNRPDWVPIPVAGILRLLDSPL